MGMNSQINNTLQHQNDNACQTSSSFIVQSFFWVTTRIGSHALMLKFPLCLTCCFGSCLFKAPLLEYLVCSDWSAHTRPREHCLLQQISCAKSILSRQTTWYLQIMQMWTWWRSAMSQSHKIRAGLLTRRFRCSVFCGREELLPFQLSKPLCMYKKTYYTLQKKCNRSPLRCEEHSHFMDHHITPKKCLVFFPQFCKCISLSHWYKSQSHIFLLSDSFAPLLPVGQL